MATNENSQIANDFHVIPGQVVKAILADNHSQMVEVVKHTYLQHHQAQTINPDSYFLRFPEQPSDRIIALPAAITDEKPMAGLKWIASFPHNIEQGLARASATLVLNDLHTGYPLALLEAALISAYRTASSAVLAAYWLNRQSKQARSIAFIGGGLISKHTLETFLVDGWQFDEVVVHDLNAQSAQSLSDHASNKYALASTVATDIDSALACDIVVFATNAGTPYVERADSFRPSQLVLNISLRDIAPEIILNAYNVFDDVEHCMKANTSPHLAEQQVGNRDFVTGTIAQVMLNEVETGHDKPIIFSPFGLGVLDIAVGRFVYETAVANGSAIAIDGFFGESKRW